MKNKHLFIILFFFIALFLSFASCKVRPKPIGQKEVVARPEELKPTVSGVIESSLEEAESHEGRIGNFFLKEWTRVKAMYGGAYAPIWTSDGRWQPKADSLYEFIKQARSYGLFPQDYYVSRIDTLHQKTVADTTGENKLNASLWAESDLLLTSAFITIIHDLKAGRLMSDSARKNNSSLTNEFYLKQLDAFRNNSMIDFAANLEPQHTGYKNLKEALQNFLVTSNFQQHTKVDMKDSIQLPALLQKRLSEDSITVPEAPDSMQLSSAIKEWQLKKGLKVTGKISPSLLAVMNLSDEDKFIQVAITMDRYKSMPALPSTYIWVNIPSFQLTVFENDTEVITSRVVVGKPLTRTPILTSAISDMITYPLWHIPNSIIVKDVLPALKKDPGYLARKGFSLVDAHHNEVDPYKIDWNKYSKDIPYTVVQGSGDDNALGVLKFNFPNPFSVYLHDTNQREFFKRSKRALSHGCVRVENWEELAQYLLNKDAGHPNAVPIDSLQTWLALKEKHVIPLHKRVPLYIRYFTSEGRNGELVFYEDIYGEDHRLRQAFFANK